MNNKTIIYKLLNISKYILYIALISGWVFIIFNLGKNNLSNENLWYDEAGQFWMAKGLNHYSPPLSKEGNLVDVIIQNSKMNSDPGGFTILLHFWAKISNSAFWLRMLPYLFFIFSMITVALVTFYFSNSTLLSLAFLYIIPFIGGDLLYYAFEIRSYSMEYFGISLSFLLFLKLLKHNTKRNLLLLVVVMAIFCTSRYSFIVFALIISLITFIIQKNRLEKIKYYSTLALVLVLVYLLSFRVQFQAMRSIEYINVYMFKYLSSQAILNIIKTNLFSIYGLFSTCLVILGALVLFFSDIHREKVVLTVSAVLLAYSGVFCLLSFLGIHPWDVNARWNLSLQMLNILSFSAIVGYVFGKKPEIEKRALEKYTPIVCLIFIIILWKYSFNLIRYLGNYVRHNPDTISASFHAITIKSNSVFYITRLEMPTWKYLNEFGSLNNSYYPKNTIFEGPNEKVPSYVDYIIERGDENINYSDTLAKSKFKNLTVYEPTHIFQNLKE